MTGATVADVMNRDVHTVSSRATLLGAVRIMRRQRVSGLPVLDTESRLVGVLSEKDIVRDLNRAAGIASERGILELLLAARRPDHPNLLDVCEHRLLNARVAEVMTHQVVTVAASDPLEEAVARMRRYGVNRLPVVDGRRVVGILTRQDLLTVPPAAEPAPAGGPEGPGPLLARP